MAETSWKPIKAIKSSSDLRAFTQFRPVDLKNFFASFWQAILDMLILNKSFQFALEVFINTLYFYPGSNTSEFEKAHKKIISEFTSALNQQDQAKSKQVLTQKGLWELLENIGKFVGKDSESYVAPLSPLLMHLKISVIEKTDSYEDFPWAVQGNVLTLSLFENEEEFFLLYPKNKLNLPGNNSPDEAITTDEASPLRVSEDNSFIGLDEDDDVLQVLGDEEENTGKADRKSVRFEARPQIELGVNQKTEEKIVKTPEKKVEILEKPVKTPEKPVEIPEKPVKVSEKVVEETKVSISKSEKNIAIEIEEYEEYEEEKYENPLEPASFCGALACVRCFRNLAKTSHFLINSVCCYKAIYNSRSAPIPRDAVPSPSNKKCILCQKADSKPNKILCVCCFLNVNVWNTKKFEPSEGCGIYELNHWVDIEEGKDTDLIQCSFCDEFRHKSYVCQACPTCSDTVCLACLRRNSFIAEGICSNCHARREISIMSGKKK